MSKTDKTTPWKIVERRGDCPRECKTGGYPCKHFSSSGSLGVIKRKMQRSQRTKVRATISQGIDPPIDQHRHRALWDLS